VSKLFSLFINVIVDILAIRFSFIIGLLDLNRSMSLSLMRSLEFTMHTDWFITSHAIILYDSILMFRTETKV